MVAAGFAAALAAAGPAMAQTGSYAETCRNIRTGEGLLTAECRDVGGRYHVTTLPFTRCRGEITNQNGILTCYGATATGGEYVGGGPPPRPAPGPSAYVAWGDAHYGDPQFDWRFAPGGWGYGHRPGEWVTIHDRAAWLIKRIKHAQSTGRLSRGQIDDVYRKLNAIQDMEQGFQQTQTYGPKERDMLDRRFDEIASQFRNEAEG
jgi:hypothetical protein